MKEQELISVILTTEKPLKVLSSDSANFKVITKEQEIISEILNAEKPLKVSDSDSVNIKVITFEPFEDEILPDRTISENRLDTLKCHPDLDILFIICKIDISPEQYSLIKNILGIKVVFAPQEFPLLKQIATTYIAQKLTHVEIKWYITQLVKPIEVPGMMCLDYADVASFLKSNPFLNVNCHYAPLTEIRSLLRSFYEPLPVHSCFFTANGSSDLTLDGVSSILELLTDYSSVDGDDFCQVFGVYSLPEGHILLTTFCSYEND